MSQQKFACPICEARSNLADAIAQLSKTASEAMHLSTHWRTAHEQRELSNLEAEARTVETLAQFDADMANEDTWYNQHVEAVAALFEASKAACEARAIYHQRLKAYTDTRVPKNSCCSQ